MAINGNDLFKRICAGAVYIGVTGACTLLSWQTTVAVIAVTAAICCYEFLRMARNQGYRPYMRIGIAAAACIPLAMGANYGGTHVVAIGLGVCMLASIACSVHFLRHPSDTVIDLCLTIFGILYTSLTLSSFLLLRGVVHGLPGGLMCVLVLLSVWMNDAFAYLGGSAFGRHKFSPKISPKKTWEGVICGMIGSMVFWLLIPLVVPACGFGYVWAAISGLVCGAVGIFGDLFESRIKRSLSTKDSGTLMPGHGGLLDRSDSLLFVSVVAYFLVVTAPFAAFTIGIPL